MDIEQFFYWLYEVERFFDIMQIEPAQKVSLVAYKLKGRAGVWWQRHQEQLGMRGQRIVRDWEPLKALLKSRFLPFDYEQTVFQELQNCYQGTRTMAIYTEEFLQLQSRYDLSETEDQQVVRYVNGLSYSIQDHLAMQSIWYADQAQNLALGAERILKNRRLPWGTTNR